MDAAFRGEVQRALLGILRTSGEAQTTLQLTDALMKVRGLNTADRILTPQWSVRMMVDFQPTHYGLAFQKDVAASIGVAYKFGAIKK